MKIFYFIIGFLISSVVSGILMCLHQRMLKNKLLDILKLNSSDYLKYFVSVSSDTNFIKIFKLIEDKFKLIYKNYEDLKNYKLMLSKVIEFVDNGILILDKSNRICFANDLGVSILRIEDIKIFLGKIISDTDLNWILEFEDLKVFELPEEYSGRNILCYVEIYDDYKIYKFRDIAEYRRLEYMSGEFISNITHELKTPLTSIIGFSETLKNVEEEEERKIFYEIINKEAVRLNNLIRDILIFSEIETQNDMNKQRIDLFKILHEIKQLLSPQISKANFDVNISESKIIILNNEKYLRQIFINIMDNSIKHSFGTKIEINCFENDNSVYIDFCDNGIGIPDEDIKNIFDRFYKVPNSKSKSRGTGLGLSIVENFVKKINGTINVFNNDKGITFRIVIPKR